MYSDYRLVREALKTLEGIYRDDLKKGETSAHTVATFIDKTDRMMALTVIGLLVTTYSWDERLDAPNVQFYASLDLPTGSDGKAVYLGTNVIHMAHLNQMAQELRTGDAA